MNLSFRRFIQRLTLREIFACSQPAYPLLKHASKGTIFERAAQILSAYATADTDIEGDTMTYFDTDSSFLDL